MTNSRAFAKTASYGHYRVSGKGFLHISFILLLTFLLTASSIAFFTNASIVNAQANDTISFQSKIVQRTTGLNVEAGSPACVVAGADTCDFRASIYTDSSGGTLLWQEPHTDVELGDNAGIFNLELNSICSSWDAPSGSCSGSGISDWSSDSTIYLQIEIDTDGDGDFASGGPDTVETFARKVFTSVPFAYQADNAANLDTGLVDTNGLNAYLDIAAATTASAQLNFASSSGVNPTTPNAGDLWFNGTNLNFYDGSSTTDLLAAASASPFTNDVGITYLTDTAEDFAVGGTTLASVFSVDVDTNTLRIGDGANDANDPSLVFYASDATNSGTLSYLDSDAFSFTGGDVDIDQAVAIGSLASVSSATALRIEESFSAASGASHAINIDVTRGGTLSADTTAYGIYTKLFYDIVENGFNATAYASESITDVDGSESYNRVAGARNAVISNSSSTDQDMAIGALDEVVFSGSGTIVNAYGTRGRALSNGTGTISSAYGVQGVAFTANSSASITDAYGLYGFVHEGSGGTITNGYGVYSICQDAATCYGLRVVAGDAEVVTDWGVYVTGEDQNYFSGDVLVDGNIGVSQANPTARLDIFNDDTSISSVRVTHESDIYVKTLSGAAASVSEFRDIALTPDGGYVAVGYTNTSGGNGDQDMYVVKYDVDGAIVWQRAIGGANADQAYGVDVYPDGSIVVAGNTSSFVAGTSQAAYLVRLGSDGTFQWGASRAWIADSTYFMAHDDVEIHQNGEIVTSSILRNVAGTQFYSTVCRYDNSGFFRQCNYWDGGAGYNNTYGLRLNKASDGNLLLAGRNANFGTGGNIATVQRMSLSGLYSTPVEVAPGVGGTGDDVFAEAIQDADGGFVAVGNTNSFGAGGQDFYVVKFDRIGQLEWTRTIGTTNDEYARAIELTPEGDYIVVGQQTVSGNQNGYVVRLTRQEDGSAPTVAWTRSIGGSSAENFERVVAANDSSYILVGGTSSYGTGATNAYLVRLDENGDCGTCSDITTPSAPSTGTGGTLTYGGTSMALLGGANYGNTTGGSTATMSLTNNDRCTDTLNFTAFEVEGNGDASFNGDLDVSGTISGGVIQGNQLRMSNFDLAEEYLVDDQSIGAGDVVRFKEDADGRLIVERAGGEDGAYDDKAIGVISTAPGLYLQDWETSTERGRPLGLAGRVPVKVTNENGPIKRGDYLTASSTSGYAMKATDGGVIIGRAMEDFDPEIAEVGDSALVGEFVEDSLQETELILEEMAQQGAISEDSIQDISNEVAEIAVDHTTPAEQSITEEQEDQNKQGRIMMFIDLGYRPAEAVNANSQAHSGVEVVSESENPAALQNMFELVGSGSEKVVELNVSEFIVEGAMVIRGDLTVTGSLEVEQELKFGRNNASVGEAVIPAGETTVQVFNLSVTADSTIVASPDQFVTYKIVEIEEGFGFKIQITEPLDKEVRFTYFLAIVE